MSSPAVRGEIAVGEALVPHVSVSAAPGVCVPEVEPLHLDHLVIGATTLAEGIAWCEASFGFTPVAGGSHAFMGTHNRVFSVASAAFPRTYLEIIAIDPTAPAPGRTRWFDLDSAALHATLRHGPQLIHWVARCHDIASATRHLQTLGAEPGAVEQARRGDLRWQIGLRPDGQRLFGGAWPTLIQWGDAHPADAMQASGVTLESVVIGGLPSALAARLPAPAAIDPNPGAAPIAVTLNTPRGRIDLSSQQLSD
ncbi:VOC family protein [soil metagenome]